jgi:hypothetical protein
VFVLAKSFQLCLKFPGKARSLPHKGNSVKCSTLEGFGLAQEHCTRLGRLTGTNTLAYLASLLATKNKGFITSNIAFNVAKVFLSVTDKEAK